MRLPRFKALRIRIIIDGGVITFTAYHQVCSAIRMRDAEGADMIADRRGAVIDGERGIFSRSQCYWEDGGIRHTEEASFHGADAGEVEGSASCIDDGKGLAAGGIDDAAPEIPGVGGDIADRLIRQR